MAKGAFNVSKFFKDLKDGLEEALAHAQGATSLKSEWIEIPEEPSKGPKAKDGSEEFL